MSERMAGEIWIGGKLRRRLFKQFPIADMRLDWDYTPFDSSTVEGILDARDGNQLLHFCDCEAAYGEFPQLERWLRDHKLPFRRHSSGKYEYLPELVEFRPDLSKGIETYSLSTDDGEPLVLKCELTPIVTAMTELRKSQKSADEQLRAWRRLATRLAKALPPDLPPLPPFEIVR